MIELRFHLEKEQVDIRDQRNSECMCFQNDVNLNQLIASNNPLTLFLSNSNIGFHARSK